MILNTCTIKYVSYHTCDQSRQRSKESVQWVANYVIPRSVLQGKWFLSVCLFLFGETNLHDFFLCECTNFPACVSIISICLGGGGVGKSPLYQNLGLTHIFIVVSITMIIASVISYNRASTSTAKSLLSWSSSPSPQPSWIQPHHYQPHQLQTFTHLLASRFNNKSISLIIQLFHM